MSEERPRSQDIRAALGRFVTGVTVLTVLDAQGHLAGLTANSFTSVSLDPPTVLVCVGCRTRSYDALVRCRRFAIHILGEDQREAAAAFATRGGERSGVCRWGANSRGYGVLRNALAVLECRLAAEHPAGDHAIVVGAVEHFETAAASGVPLVCYGGKLFGLGGAAA
ncbi:MAG: flavin reductase family protein [Acetobacteraceae bacterium]